MIVLVLFIPQCLLMWVEAKTNKIVYTMYVVAAVCQYCCSKPQSILTAAASQFSRYYQISLGLKWLVSL